MGSSSGRSGRKGSVRKRSGKHGVRARAIGAACVAIAWVASGVVGSVLRPGDSRDVNDVVLQMAGTSFTVLSLVFALSVPERQRWPGIWDLAREALLPWWTGVTAAAVTTAMLDCELARDTAIGLAFASSALAVWGAYRLIAGAEPTRRREQNAKRLVRRLVRYREHSTGLANRDSGKRTRSAGSIHGGHDEPLGEYLSVWRENVQTSDIAGLEDRCHELSLALRKCGPDESISAATLGLKIIDDALTAACNGHLDDWHGFGETLSRLSDDLVLRIGEIIGSSRMAERRAHDRNVCEDPTGPAEDATSERVAAVVMGQLSRIVARAGLRAVAAWQYEGRERSWSGGYIERLEEVMDLSISIRRGILDAVDPDPPDTYLPLEHPWSQGLQDPVAVLLWDWGYVDWNAPLLGTDQYVLCEVLTGKKFLGSFGWRRGCPLTYIADRLRDPEGAKRAQVCGRSGAGRLGASRDAVAIFGGLPVLASELGALSLSLWKPRSWRAPHRVAGVNGYSSEPFRLARRMRLFALRREEDRLGSANEALALVALLTAPEAVSVAEHVSVWGLEPPRQFEPVRFGDFAKAAYEHLKLPGPPQSSRSERVGAAVLAAALRLYPVSTTDDYTDRRRETEVFLAALPMNVLATAGRLARSLDRENFERGSCNGKHGRQLAITGGIMSVLDVMWRYE